LLDSVPATHIGALPAAAWWLLFVPGLLRFAAEHTRYRRTLARWRERSYDGAELLQLVPPDLQRETRGVRIRVLWGAAEAAATGIVRPTVWIGDRLLCDGARAALTHELCHLRRHDPLWLIAIALLARVFWWNPIVALQARTATRALEVACDRDCARWLGPVGYGRALAELLLRTSAAKGLALAATIASSSFNVRRLAELERAPRFGVRAALALAICASGSLSAASFGVALPDPRLGSWMEVTNSSPSSPIWRRFSDEGGGLMRLDSYIAPDGTVTAWADLRCDGRDYELRGRNGPLGFALRCHRAGPRRIDDVFSSADRTARDLNVVEEVSADGETYTVTVTKTGLDGQTVDVAHRVFWRLH
jgi:hypothetical protein